MSTVVVVGGGPAGMATAISLVQHDRTLRVIVIERSDYTQLRIGETLPPTAEPLLKQLRVWDSFIVAGHKPAYSSLCAWGSPELLTNEFLDRPHNRGWHLDRQAFDVMLAAEAESRGVQVMTHATVAANGRSSDGRWRLSLCNSDGVQSVIEADFVVDATGRRSDISVSQRAKRVSYDRLLALIAFIDVKQDHAAPSTTLIEACEYGWWYSSNLPGNKLIVACMTDTDIATKLQLRLPEVWREHMIAMPYTASRVLECTAELDSVNPMLWPASSSKLDHAVGERWLAVGDAAATFDPLSSQGVFKALRSGILASYAILDFFAGNAEGLARYEAIIEREYGGYLETRGSFYAEEQRWPESPFWNRRHEKITLDPHSALAIIPPLSPQRISQLPLNLVPADLHILCTLCNGAKPAHEVVASFVNATNARISDRQTIIALQQLLHHGILQQHNN